MAAQPLYRKLAPELLAAGLPSPLREHFLSGRYREFEQLTRNRDDHQIELCRSYIHYALAQAFQRDGAHCCARLSLLQLDPKDPWTSARLTAQPQTADPPDSESQIFYALRHFHQAGQLPRTLPIEQPQGIDLQALGTAAYPGPYLAAPNAEVQAWSRRLSQWQDLRVGLIWAPSRGQARLTLQALSRLANGPRGTFFGLQQGPHQIQSHWPPPELPFVDLSEFIEDWANMAGLLQNLDLLISVDHPAAHLAGALGLPVWILGRGLGDYGPLMHNFCCPRGDWDRVLGRIRKKLWTSRYSKPRGCSPPLRNRQHANPHATHQHETDHRASG